MALAAAVVTDDRKPVEVRVNERMLKELRALPAPADGIPAFTGIPVVVDPALAGSEATAAVVFEPLPVHVKDFPFRSMLWEPEDRVIRGLGLPPPSFEDVMREQVRRYQAFRGSPEVQGYTRRPLLHLLRRLGPPLYRCHVDRRGRPWLKKCVGRGVRYPRFWHPWPVQRHATYSLPRTLTDVIP